MQAKQQIAQLIAKSKKKSERGTHDFRALLNDLWSLPQIRLLCLTLILAGRIVVFWQFESAYDSKAFEAWNFLFLPPIAIALAKWTALQYAEDGLLQLLVKWSLVFSGSVWSCYLLTYCFPWDHHWVSGLVYKTSLSDPVAALIVLAIFSTLAISRLSAWLVEDVGTKFWESEPMQTVRGYF